MGTTLDNAMSRLAAELPLREEQIEELMRLLRELHKEGWDGSVAADEAVRVIAGERSGNAKGDAKWRRKAERLAAELAHHIAKNGAMRHEVKKLEDLLTWIHRTEQPIEDIRGVIERTIPRRLAREEGTNAQA